MTNLARYHAANLPELFERINRNSIGLDDYLNRFWDDTTTSKPSFYPPYNLVQINNALSKLEIALQGLRKMKSKSIRSLGSYLWKAKKKNRKMMENLSTKDWPNVPLPNNGRSPTIQRLDPSALRTDSSPWS